MPDILEQISSILTEPYGTLAYHLVISFIMIGVLYPALVFSSHEKPARRRLLLGIFGLLASTVFTLFVIPVTYWLLYAHKPGHGVPLIRDDE